MEIGTQIKKYRTQNNLSQEELAEQIYVTRQTISNWENDKNYPDIHSLVLLSQVFSISLDTLVKGDLKQMKAEIHNMDIKQFHHDSNIFTVLFILMMTSIIPLFHYLKYFGLIIWGFIVVLTFFYALKIEKQKKKYDIQTYKEIIAFSEGKKLDEITKLKESGKQSYQKFFLSLFFALCTAIITLIMAFIFLK